LWTDEVAFKDAKTKMAEENLNWSTAPVIMVQTILTVKEFLDTEIQKYEDLNHAGDFARPLFPEEGGFQKAKKEGVGRYTILKFLGGNWTEHKAGVLIPEQFPQGRPKKKKRLDEQTFLEDMGISRFQSSRWQQEAKVPGRRFVKQIKTNFRKIGAYYFLE
jgi:hypothetical protein